MLTNVQVLAGTTSVARFGDVLVWFETGPDGGGPLLSQVLEAVRGAASGALPPGELGARLAAVLNTGDAAAVPALVAAVPEGDGLRVVVHGWGAVVADGLHLPNGWVDQVVADRRTFFVGRNTVTPVAPVEGSAFHLEEGIVPGAGVSFGLSPATGSLPASSSAPQPEAVPAPAEPPAYEPPPSDPPPASEAGRPDAPPVGTPGPGAAPVAWPPPGADPTPRAGAAAAPLAGPAPQAPPGRLVLDDGHSAPLERTCVIGSAPHGSPAVQTGVALPLTVVGVGVAPVHVEIRVEGERVAVRDLGGAVTYVLLPGTSTWAPLAAGQISQLEPGTRVALGERTLSYERP